MSRHVLSLDLHKCALLRATVVLATGKVVKALGMAAITFRRTTRARCGGSGSVTSRGAPSGVIGPSGSIPRAVPGILKGRHALRRARCFAWPGFETLGWLQAPLASAGEHKAA